MPLPRKRLIDASKPGWVHCINRCVRRAFLAGDGKEHRKQWIEQRLRELSGVYACEIAAYAVMSNHLHVVVRMLPEVTAEWSAEEVTRRWLAVFGTRVLKGADGQVSAETIAGYAANAEWVAERRVRLGNLSWFMRSLAEPIAVRANREDGCTGRFWEGRFTSVPLLDQAALVACMAYVDLNPIRAQVADRPERSAETGVRERIRARQRHRIGQKAQRLATPAQQKQALRRAGLVSPPPHAEAGLWLAPLSRCLVAGASSSQGWSVDEYLKLVDITGRMIAKGKKGAIPPELAPILQRLDLTVEDWLATVTGWRSMLGSALGHASSRSLEAARRGLGWVRNRCPLFGKKSLAA